MKIEFTEDNTHIGPLETPCDMCGGRADVGFTLKHNTWTICFICAEPVTEHIMTAARTMGSDYWQRKLHGGRLRVLGGGEDEGVQGVNRPAGPRRR